MYTYLRKYSLVIMIQSKQFGCIINTEVVLIIKQKKLSLGFRVI